MRSLSRKLCRPDASRKNREMGQKSALPVVADAEIFGEFGLHVRVFFRDVLDHGAAWSALEHGPQARKTFGCADGINFDSPVAQIAHVTAQFQAFGFILCVVTETDALHNPGNEIAARDRTGSHGT